MQSLALKYLIYVKKLSRWFEIFRCKFYSRHIFFLHLGFSVFFLLEEKNCFDTDSNKSVSKGDLIMPTSCQYIIHEHMKYAINTYMCLVMLNKHTCIQFFCLSQQLLSFFDYQSFWKCRKSFQRCILLNRLNWWLHLLFIQTKQVVCLWQDGSLLPSSQVPISHCVAHAAYCIVFQFSLNFIKGTTHQASKKNLSKIKNVKTKCSRTKS